MLTSDEVIRRSDARTATKPGANCSVWFTVVALALACLPVVNIVFVLAGCGVDNLCNDYLQYAGLIDRIMSGNYNWLNFISDTFYRTHSVALPVALHVACARFFHLSVYPELSAGVTFALLRLVILYAVLSRPLKGPAKLALLPALSALIFSNSQMSVFCYGDGALTIELSLLGFALVLGGLALANRAGDALVGAGGLIASFSWGNGLVSWLVAASGFIASGSRRASSYLCWLFGFALSAAPYLQALVLSPLAHHGPARTGTTLVSLFNWRFIVGALGFPFSNGIALHADGLASARLIGLAGLAAFAAAVCLATGARDKELMRKAMPALLCIMHGLLSLWQISAFRSLIAPWYTAVACSFWIGLIALAPLFYQELIAGGKNNTLRLKKAAAAWCIMVPLAITIAYLLSNLTYEDKDTLLFARSPASATALRHWQDGPTYGEQYVFQWGGGNPGLLSLLARPLEKHNLSVFSPRQTWTLQGDFLLDSVRFSSPESSYTPFWTTGLDQKGRLPWFHNRHLNLVLPAPYSVSWSFQLPADTAFAELRSRTATILLPGGKASNTATLVAVYLKTEGGSERMLYNFMAKEGHGRFHDWNLPLAQYKGQKITIRMSCTGANGAAAVFHYPSIEIQRAVAGGVNAAAARSETMPSNCYQSLEAAGASPGDLCFASEANSQTSLTNGQAGAFNFVPEASGSEALPAYRRAQLGNYSHCAITLALSPSVSPRMVAATLHTTSGNPAFQVPLVADGAAHTYTYDLKLLELPGGSRVTGLTLTPASGPQAARGETLVLSDVRLLRKRP